MTIINKEIITTIYKDFEVFQSGNAYSVKLPDGSVTELDDPYEVSPYIYINLGVYNHNLDRLDTILKQRADNLVNSLGVGDNDFILNIFKKFNMFTDYNEDDYDSLEDFTDELHADFSNFLYEEIYNHEYKDVFTHLQGFLNDFKIVHISLYEHTEYALHETLEITDYFMMFEKDLDIYKGNDLKYAIAELEGYLNGWASEYVEFSTLAEVKSAIESDKLCFGDIQTLIGFENMSYYESILDPLTPEEAQELA